MPKEPFNKYIDDINRAYLKGDATEHTHRPALKALIWRTLCEIQKCFNEREKEVRYPQIS